MTSYTAELNEITDFIRKFFVFAEQGNYGESLTNSRKLAEGICKLVVFHHHGRPNQVIDYPSTFTYSNGDARQVQIRLDGLNYKFLINKSNRPNNFQKLMLADLIWEVKNLVTESRFHQALALLKDQGNPTAHASGGRELCTEDDFLTCEPELKFLAHWLFQHLQRSLSHEIEEIFSGAYKRLSVFLPLPSVLKLGKLGQLFYNQLVYFTPAEHSGINQLCDTLQQEHIALLQGQPAKGKTVTAFAVAQRMEEAGWQVYYHSFKTDAPSCWPDIERHLYRKFLFILDDCHLNTEALSDIYARIHDLSRTVALLCISRPLADSLQESPNYDFNVFAELREVTFAPHECDTAKIAGITEARQRFYQQSGGEYHSGDTAKLADKVYGNLVMLSFYLEQWQRTHDLEQVNDAQVLNGIYTQYFKALDKRSCDCLVQYACLFCFEIEFEALPDYEQETERLAESGIIEHQHEHIYCFYHSEFAHLLIQAYAAHEGSRFFRKNKMLQNFILQEIKSYLCSFKEPYGYPIIMHNLFISLARSSQKTVLEYFIMDEELKSIFIDYYRNETSLSNISDFLIYLSRYLPGIFNSWFEELVISNQSFYQAVFEDSFSLKVYSNIIFNLQKNKNSYEHFCSKWGDKTQKVFNLSEPFFYSHALLKWQRLISKREAQEIFFSLRNEFFLEKLAKCTFRSLSRRLSELEKVNPEKTAELFCSLNNNLLLKKIEEESFSDMASSFNELAKVDVKKSVELFSAVNIETSSTKLKNENIINIAHSLSEIKKVNLEKASILFSSIDNEILLKKIKIESFHNIGTSLNELWKISKDKTSALIFDIDNNILLEKIEIESFRNIAHGLNQISKISSQKAAELFYSIDNEILLGKIEKETLSNIGGAFNELGKISLEKSSSLYYYIDNNVLLTKIDIERLSGIGGALNALCKINPRKAFAFFELIDDEYLLDKIEDEKLTSIAYALSNMRKINPEKSSELFDKIKIENLHKKILENRLLLSSISLPLSQFYPINPKKTKELFNLIRADLPINDWLLEIQTTHSQKIFYQFGIFTLLDPKFSKSILQQVQSYLVKHPDLLHIRNYTNLISWLFRCGFTIQDTLVKEALTIGNQNIYSLLLDNSLTNIVNFFNSLNNYTPIKPLIHREYDLLLKKIFFEDNKSELSRYIAFIHKIDEKVGLQFLDVLKKHDSSLIEQFGFIHLYIAQNYQKQDNPTKANKHFSQAEKLLRQVAHAEGLALLEKSQQGEMLEE